MPKSNTKPDLPASELPKGARRRGTLVGLGIGLVIGLTAGGVGAGWVYFDAMDLVSEADAAADESLENLRQVRTTALQRENRLATRIRRLEALADVQRAKAALREGDDRLAEDRVRSAARHLAEDESLAGVHDTLASADLAFRDGRLAFDRAANRLDSEVREALEDGLDLPGAEDG